jgi:hypothetical protein
MDLEVLKKKISTFRGEGGRVLKVSDELLMEILMAWENWSGPAKGFYKAIGVSQKGMASMLGKAKKLKREGHFPVEEFKEVVLEESDSASRARRNLQHRDCVVPGQSHPFFEGG